MGSPSASAAASPSESAAPSAPTAEPSPALGDFTCDLPITGAATVPQTVNYTEIRVGSHDGYDRVVFEFANGIPEVSLEVAQPPYLQDASGQPLEVDGDTVLRLVMRNTTALTESGEISYDGPRRFDPAFPRLLDVVAGGDFEAVTTWYIGLSGDPCLRVFALGDPDRLVIDVEQ
jgi:hypothetical protein